MTELKERRQKAIAELIREHALASQEEVASRLVSLGFEVTQATVSRDLEQLGALKVRRDGVTSYALPDRTGRMAARRLGSPRFCTTGSTRSTLLQRSSSSRRRRAPGISSEWRSMNRRFRRSSAPSAVTTRFSRLAEARLTRSRSRRRYGI
ncbi:hypothetical protein H9L15_03290 [Sphingomonas daechungensis]|uniref:Arginine repressor n=1 Tax=Sphingomonas daechungensis TaxID=1176646 RepID=A0ABX6T1K3_9SPHN|nr:hypothetical protein [Sphingomonas daechungensis]QNP43716.1 hypothetical protein H9L15_03290 [Sphingomonas daechungensis]